MTILYTARARASLALATVLLMAAPGLAQEAVQTPLPPEGLVSDAEVEAADEAVASGTAEQPAAQAAAGEAQADGSAPVNPHKLLGELNGGPAGSPTALRGNPLPGTSTSIPTTNPAPVQPLPERQGLAVERENTGIDGQCDPVVSLGNCPPRAAAGAIEPDPTQASESTPVKQ